MSPRSALLTLSPLRLRPLLAMLVLSLAACSSGPDPAVTALRDTAPAQGMARIVVFYPPHFFSSGQLMSVEFNGSSDCNLKSGTFIAREVPPGDQQLKFSFCSLFITAPYHINAVAGEKYYLRVTPYDSSITGMLSGYPAESGPYDLTPHVGAFEITKLKEDEALGQLEHLRPVATP